MSRRFIVLEVEPQADILLGYLQHFIMHHATAGISTPSRQLVHKFLYETVVHIVDNRRAYKDCGDYHVPLACTLFNLLPGKVLDHHAQVVKQIINDPLFDGIYTELELQIQRHVGTHTYTVWEVINIGGVIGLAEGQDFRITEYYRMADLQNNEDTAILTLNCENPVNYLLNEYMKTFGPVLAQPDFLKRLRQWTEDTASYHKLVQLAQNPILVVVGIFLDTLKSRYPTLELEHKVPQVNDDFFEFLGIWNLEEFKANYVTKVIMGFGLSYFSSYLKRDKKYVLEYSPSHILAIYEQKFASKTEQEMHELLQALLNGDYLPPHERAIAERLYQESNH